MKKHLLVVAAVFSTSMLAAQVSQLSSNKSLHPYFNMNSGTGILYSDIDSTYWATNGTAVGTVQLSPAIFHIGSGGGGGLTNGKLVFAARSTAAGKELFITDGTPGGTKLLKDINPGVTSSDPQNFAQLNNEVFFTCETAAAGLEVWKTDGTLAGTVMLKDIVPGATGSNTAAGFELYSTGDYLLLSATLGGRGHELWKSDGTETGTVLLKDINPAANASSDPLDFFAFGNTVYFVANDGTHGKEIWRTDGTPAGTVLLKDINPATLNSVTSGSFHVFNSKVYFVADNTVNGQELWSTDGTEPGTTMVKDINPGPVGSFVQLFFSMNLPSKFIFTAYTTTNGAELWQTDGTAIGTTMVKDIQPGNAGSNPFILPPLILDPTNGTFDNPPFKGNKIFMMASTSTGGTELWITDGTTGGTNIVKDIRPGPGSGLTSPAWFYSRDNIYFAANDSSHGEELWRSDGTTANTSLVSDINPGLASADILFGMIVNNKLIFRATNGDNTDLLDVYRLDANVVSLPIKLNEFTVVQKDADAVLQWSTLSEVNTKDFTVQRSWNGSEFVNIGTVSAAGNSSDKRTYSFKDAGVLKSVKTVVYYRLMLANKDGKTELTNILWLRVKGTPGSVILVENPVRSLLSVRYREVDGKSAIYVRDMAGKKVSNAFSISGTGELGIPVGNLSPGIYVLVAEGEQGRTVINFVKK